MFCSAGMMTQYYLETWKRLVFNPYGEYYNPGNIYKKNIDDMIKYLTMSQIEEYSQKYDLRPGMGLAYPQIGISKRIFVIVDEIEKGKFENYIIINPN